MYLAHVSGEGCDNEIPRGLAKRLTVSLELNSRACHMFVVCYIIMIMED